MKKKKAILIISGQSDPTGLDVGNTEVGSGMRGKVDMTITSFKHQTAFGDQPIILEVKEQSKTYFDDAHPITSIRYNHMRNDAVVTTCTFIS